MWLWRREYVRKTREVNGVKVRREKQSTHRLLLPQLLPSHSTYHPGGFDVTPFLIKPPPPPPLLSLSLLPLLLTFIHLSPFFFHNLILFFSHFLLLSSHRSPSSLTPRNRPSSSLVPVDLPSVSFHNSDFSLLHLGPRRSQPMAILLWLRYSV